MADKKILAYCVTESYEGNSVIEFASSAIAARRYGANQLDTDFKSIESCRRAKWADQYADERVIPPEAYIANGWWFECHHCGTRVDGETEGRVIDGNAVFCCSDCQRDKKAKIDAQNKAFEEFKTQICSTRPDLTFTHFRGEWPNITMSASFMFDGAKFGGSIRRKNGKDELFVANGDSAAWAAYEAKRQAEHYAESGKDES